jgi:hypothetical protein
VVVGTCRADIFISDSNSLKDRRRVVRSILEHLRRNYNISATELEDNRLWRRTVLGVACIANEAKSADQTLSRVVRYLDTHPQIRLLDCQVEIQ